MLFCHPVNKFEIKFESELTSESKKKKKIELFIKFFGAREILSSYKVYLKKWLFTLELHFINIFFHTGMLSRGTINEQYGDNRSRG